MLFIIIHESPIKLVGESLIIEFREGETLQSSRYRSGEPSTIRRLPIKKDVYIGSYYNDKRKKVCETNVESKYIDDYNCCIGVIRNQLIYIYWPGMICVIPNDRYINKHMSFRQIAPDEMAYAIEIIGVDSYSTILNPSKSSLNYVQLPTLRSISISYIQTISPFNSTDLEDIRAITHIIESAPKLCILHLSLLSIDDACMVMLLDSLIINTTIEDLGINIPNDTPEIMSKCLELITKNKTIKYMDLGHIACIGRTNERFLLALQTNFKISSFNGVLDQYSDSTEYANIITRNMSMTPLNMYYPIMGYTIAMFPLKLPVYVLLWILDWLEPFSFNIEWNHIRKIRLIESITSSCQKVVKNRLNKSQKLMKPKKWTKYRFSQLEIANKLIWNCKIGNLPYTKKKSIFKQNN